MKLQDKQTRTKKQRFLVTRKAAKNSPERSIKEKLIEEKNAMQMKIPLLIKKVNMNNGSNANNN